MATDTNSGLKNATPNIIKTTLKTSKSKRKVKETCCSICLDTIEECEGGKAGHDAVFCDGLCQGWLHRGCAGLTKTAFSTVSRSEDPFFCPHCRLDYHNKEITFLKDTLKSLMEELKHSNANMIEQNSDSNNVENNVENVPPSTTYAEVISSSCKKTILNSNSETTVQKRQNKFVPIQEKKFNVLIFGIQECPKGFSRQSHSESDIKTAVSILSYIDSTICDQNISDVYCVGKYNSERQRPRPTLVKFIRSADASNVLFKRNMTPKPYVIKPDLSKLERIRNSVLLNERWSLIQSGIDRKSIKIRNHSIYVCNKI